MQKQWITLGTSSLITLLITGCMVQKVQHVVAVDDANLALPANSAKPKTVYNFTDEIAKTRDDHRLLQLPHAAILLNKSFFPLNWNVMRKNRILCEQLVTYLPKATVNTDKTIAKNEITTYMLTKYKFYSIDKPEYCETFINRGYDYTQADQEIKYIFNNKKPIGRSPYLAVYHNAGRDDVAVLALGELSPHSFAILGNKWGKLIAHTQKYGQSIDPVFGVLLLIQDDPDIQDAEKKALQEKIQIAIKGTMCGINLTLAYSGQMLTLDKLLNEPACQTVINETRQALT